MALVRRLSSKWGLRDRPLPTSDTTIFPHDVQNHSRKGEWEILLGQAWREHAYFMSIPSTGHPHNTNQAAKEGLCAQEENETGLGIM